MMTREQDSLTEELAHLSQVNDDIAAGDDSPEKRNERRETADKLVERIKAGKARARAAMKRRGRE